MRTPPPMRPLVCIRHEAGDTMGVALPTFEKEGADVRVVDAWDANLVWPEPREVAGLVVFGGEMNADDFDRHPYLHRERVMLRTAVEAGVPVLGVCLGAQLLARALDALVTVSRVSEFGFTPIWLTEAGELDLLLESLSTGDRMFQWHRDTFQVPAGAELLATGNRVTNQAYRFGSHAWGVQFHPEVTASNLEDWFAEVGDERLERDWGRRMEDVRAEMHEHLPLQHERAKDLFGRFARLAAGVG